MQENMGHIIWSLQPKCLHQADGNDRLRQLAGRCLAPPISDSLQWDDNLGSLHLSPVQRKECYLICKGASHNIIRNYAACTKVTIVFTVNQNRCVDISDNGKGFDNQFKKYGNGLYSMQQRAESQRITENNKPARRRCVGQLMFSGRNRKIW